ncbi:MAG: YicC/YloC family endoribonuclease [Clostridia bacterium]|nr:YicC/YloC family endoribonuclease [Clostridia bacterium]
MLKSMTGYGRQESLTGGKKILVEIRSVNQRFTDYSIKVPRNLGFLEERVRSFASEYITRGKVDIYITVESYDEADKEITLNSALARNYVEVLRQLRDELDLNDDISVMNVARFTDIFKAERREEDNEELWELVKGVTAQALEAFSAMREREGARIEKDLTERIEYMKTLAEKIDERSPETVAEYRNRLLDKIHELLGDREIDESRILTEVAIFADKIAVNEETVRLGSHFEEFYNIIGSGEPAGRKLDFLIQEINREVNTIGSKAQDIEIAKLVVELKGEIEKLREQVQNIE